MATGRTLGDQGALVLRLTRATVNVPIGTRRGLETTGISDRNGCKTGVIVASLADNVGDVWGLRKSKVSDLGRPLGGPHPAGRYRFVKSLRRLS
jgi:hypothetical protein